MYKLCFYPQGGMDGVEYLHIPLDNATLGEFLENHESEQTWGATTETLKRHVQQTRGMFRCKMTRANIFVFTIKLSLQ